MREAREPYMPVGRARREKKKRIFSISPQVSLSVFSLVPDLYFDYSRVLEYAKIRTVLQSSTGEVNEQSLREVLSSEDHAVCIKK